MLIRRGHLAICKNGSTIRQMPAPRHHILSASPSSSRGVSMVEVLIALVIFSIGLLGLALLEVRGVTFSKQSQARTQAVISAVSMADRMTANPAGVSAGDYVWDSSAQSLPSLTDCSSTPCTPAQVANNDINEWGSGLAAAVPSSSDNTALSKIVSNADGSYTISVSWSSLGLLGSQSTTSSDAFVFMPDIAL